MTGAVGQHRVVGTQSLRIEEVSKTVGTVEILRPTSFEVLGGRATALVGPNGSGKTTLLRIVLGRDAPTTGAVWLSNDARASEPGIASLTDAAPLYRDLTIREHLELVQASWGGTARAGEFLPVVERFQAGGILEQFPGELSSGERQLVGLVCTLYRPAALIVLDEPEQRLDEARRVALAEALRERAAAGAGILIATHDAGLRLAVADEVVDLGPRHLESSDLIADDLP